jgi:RimJ/RimL family protein N-acetyltransferase
VAERYDSIRTERLIMRRWRDSDREPFAALNADPETMRYFLSTLDRAQSDAIIDRIEALFDEKGYGVWALEVAESAEFIGFTGLNPLPADMPCGGGTEVAWRLARSSWHHGYATEAARAALHVAFGGLQMAEILAMAVVVNEPSLAVMRRIGMTEFCRFDNPRIPEGSPLRPHVMYRVAASAGVISPSADAR